MLSPTLVFVGVEIWGRWSLLSCSEFHVPIFSIIEQISRFITSNCCIILSASARDDRFHLPKVSGVGRTRITFEFTTTVFLHAGTHQIQYHELRKHGIVSTKWTFSWYLACYRERYCNNRWMADETTGANCNVGLICAQTSTEFKIAQFILDRLNWSADKTTGQLFLSTDVHKITALYLVEAYTHHKYEYEHSSIFSTFTLRDTYSEFFKWSLKLLLQTKHYHLG